MRSPALRCCRPRYTQRPRPPRTARRRQRHLGALKCCTTPIAEPTPALTLSALRRATGGGPRIVRRHLVSAVLIRRGRACVLSRLVGVEVRDRCVRAPTDDRARRSVRLAVLWGGAGQ